MSKRPLTAAQRRAKRRRKAQTMIIFINGRQKRVPRPPRVEGLPVDEFMRRNADPICLQQNEEWALLDAPHQADPTNDKPHPDEPNDRDLPF